MPQILDFSGMACPLPVIRTKEALESQEVQELVVVVDNEAARDNVMRFAEGRGCQVNVAAAGGCYHLTIKPAAGEVPAACLAPGVAPAPPLKVAVFASDRMGEGDPALGDILMRAFLQSLVQMEVPQKLIFYNRGALLCLDNSPVLPELKALEEMGVELLVCGTCLDFYQVRERRAVGQVSNMFTILETQMQADRLIRP
jgi:selenium metabolism protein YedF